jgi:hypothetical protein
MEIDIRKEKRGQATFSVKKWGQAPFSIELHVAVVGV